MPGVSALSVGPFALALLDAVLAEDALTGCYRRANGLRIEGL